MKIMILRPLSSDHQQLLWKHHEKRKQMLVLQKHARRRGLQKPQNNPNKPNNKPEEIGSKHPEESLEKVLVDHVISALKLQLM